MNGLDRLCVAMVVGSVVATVALVRYGQVGRGAVVYLVALVASVWPFTVWINDLRAWIVLPAFWAFFGAVVTMREASRR